MQVWRSILVCLVLRPHAAISNALLVTLMSVSHHAYSLPSLQYADQMHLMRIRKTELLEDDGIDYEFAQEQRACKLIQNYWLGKSYPFAN